MGSGGYRTVSGLVFALVALMHLVRAVRGLPVVAGDWQVPVLVSWVAVAVAGGLAVWAFRSRG